MGPYSGVFETVLAAFAAALTYSALSSWWRGGGIRYIGLAGVSAGIGVVRAIGAFAQTATLGELLITLILLIVCAVVLIAFQRSERAAHNGSGAEQSSGGDPPEAS